MVEVILGDNVHVDPFVLLGYETGRPVPHQPTVIGSHAVIRSHTVIYCSTRIGEGLQTGHGVVIREETTLGDYCSIWNHSVVDYGCRIGHRVRIHNQVYIAQYTTIEDEVFLAPGVQIANDPHPICTLCMKGPTIRRGARIGVNVTLLPHVTIGEYALIGAGSVVTRDVPPRAVAYGNPAKVVGTVDELVCPLGLAEPYVDGLDVAMRQKRGLPVDVRPLTPGTNGSHANGPLAPQALPAVGRGDGP